MSNLASLTTDQKREVCKRRIVNAATFATLKEFIEEAYGLQTSVPTISRFFASQEGQDLLTEVHDEVKKTFQNEPLIEKASRVLAFRDKMMVLERHMTLLNDPKLPEWRALSQEFRHYAKLIQEEMVGFKITLDSELSPAEQVAARLFDELKKGIDSE